MKETIPYNPDLPAQITLKRGKWGLILAHGERSFSDKGIIASLAKKLAEKNISSVRFDFPFRIQGKKYRDPTSLDQAFIQVYNWVTLKYPDINWIIAGHDVGAESALRIVPIVDSDGEIPPLVCVGYPMYPLNRPELADPRAFSAILGEALFCQGSASKRGDFTRLQNSIKMMASHVHVKRIGNASHELEVPGKDSDRVAYWISNDIEQFIKDL